LLNALYVITFCFNDALFFTWENIPDILFQRCANVVPALSPPLLSTLSDRALFRESNHVFDDSRKKGNGLYKCEIGSDKVIRGFSMGLQMMSCGESAVLTVPSSYAYGADGVEDVFPPDTDLLFEIDLYRINGKGYYTTKEKAAFAERMKEWKANMLRKFDSKEAFAKKKIEKYGDRMGFEKYLQEKVDTDVAKVRLYPTEDAEDSASKALRGDGTVDTKDLDDVDD